MQMREILSPFRNLGAERVIEDEDDGWVINPVQVRRSPKKEKTAKEKNHVGEYIFNDSPENTYEGEYSPVESPVRFDIE